MDIGENNRRGKRRDEGVAEDEYGGGWIVEEGKAKRMRRANERRKRRVNGGRRGGKRGGQVGKRTAKGENVGGMAESPREREEEMDRERGREREKRVFLPGLGEEEEKRVS